MSDATNTSDPNVVKEGSTAATPTPAPAAPKAEPKQSEPDWLPARLQSEREREQRRIAQELGIDLPAAKEKLAALKKLEDEKKSDSEKMAERLAELDRLDKRNKALEDTITQRAQLEMSQLDAARQDAVKRVAGDDPASQLRAIDVLKPTWAATPPPSPEPPPANTGPGGDVGLKSQTPTLQAPSNHREVYLALKKENPIAAAQYGQMHPESYKLP